jgi:hypothetical protein
MDYWQHLNHTYRDLYRAHRAAEDAATQAAWEAANPDQRTAWQKLRNMDRRPRYEPALERPITFPVFEASLTQRENMMALLGLIDTADEAKRHAFTRAELHRELGQFDEARQALERIDQEDIASVCRLASQLIDQCHAAPVRYGAYVDPLRQNSCRPNRTKTLGGGDERQKWLDTDKHSKTKR